MRALSVRCNVTTLSQPAALVNVCVGSGSGTVVYSTPYHVNEPHTVTVVSP